MLRFSEKAVGGCKSQIFFIGDQNASRGDTISEALRGNEMVLKRLLRSLPGAHVALNTITHTIYL